MTALAEMRRRRPLRRLGRAFRRLDAAIDSIVDYRALEPLRIVAGVLLLVQLAPLLADSLIGVTYRDAYHAPPPFWFPELPEPAFVLALWVAAVAACCVAAGFATGIAAPVAAGFLAYYLLLSGTHYHHNRAFVLVLVIGLSLMPVGERFSLDARLGKVRRAGAGRGPRWPLMLLRFQVAAVYTASGVSKLLDADWLDGTVLRLRVATQADAALAGGVPTWLVELATSSSVQWWVAKVVIATEIFIGLGLLVAGTRWAAVWIAIAFHLAIELTAEVELFSFAALAALLIWVMPRAGDRHLVAPGSWAALVRRLDWTGRFEITSGAAWRLTDRSGRIWLGADAMWRCAALLPVAFVLAWPVSIARDRRAMRHLPSAQ